MDEPSNSMDNSTEQLLIQRLSESLKERTTILVTHKTALMALVDRIILLEDGKVVMDRITSYNVCYTKLLRPLLCKTDDEKT